MAPLKRSLTLPNPRAPPVLQHTGRSGRGRVCRSSACRSLAFLRDAAGAASAPAAADRDASSGVGGQETLRTDAIEGVQALLATLQAQREADASYVRDALPLLLHFANTVEHTDPRLSTTAREREVFALRQVPSSFDVEASAAARRPYWLLRPSAA